MKTILVMFLFCLVILFAWSDSAHSLIVETGRGWSFAAYEIKGSDYAYPAFKFAMKLADGNIVGWDDGTRQWSGNVKKSVVNSGVFNYPSPQEECTSTEPEVWREINVSGIKGEYITKNALYCRDIFSGANSFIGSGYAVLLDTPDSRYEISIYPEKKAIIHLCFLYLIAGEEQRNELCNSPEFTKNIIIAPGIEQKVEMNYNFTSEENTTVEKVVTAAMVSGSWESCNKLGLIKNSGLYTSVQKKLENATRKYDAGDINAAEGIYRALANELRAQYNKGIDAQCADILIEDLQSELR